MKHYLDLTREISMASEPYPGDPPVVFTQEATIENDGFRIRNLSFSSHQGTHIDAPAHVFLGGMFLNAFPLETFSGPARVLNLGKVRPATAITREMLELFEDTFLHCQRILFSAHWEGNFFEDAPFFTEEAAKWLVSQPELILIGFDWSSPDQFGDEELPIHKIFLRQALIFVENLTNLAQLPAEFHFSVFPMSLAEADGAPCRAVASFETEDEQ